MLGKLSFREVSRPAAANHSAPVAQGLMVQWRLWPRTGPTANRAGRPVPDPLADVRAGRFFAASMSLDGRLPTDVILRPPAALRHVAGGPTKK